MSSCSLPAGPGPSQRGTRLRVSVKGVLVEVQEAARESLWVQPNLVVVPVAVELKSSGATTRPTWEPRKPSL